MFASVLNLLFSDNCKFEHPGANKPQDSGNRFQALGNQGDSFGQGNRNNQRPAPARGQQYTST
jgi:nucleoporin NUP42